MGLPRATALVFGLLLAAAAHAQPVFPSRPVTLVLPSAPGDPTDLIARVLQPKMSERLGQQFVVENRPGGSAVIASSAVAKAPADGHTLLLALSAHSINPIALKELPYDTFRDFAPVTLLARFALIVGASSSVKGSDLYEFVAAAKGRGNVNFASGKLKPLAVTSPQRSSQLPGVPTVAESGFPGFEAYNWVGVFAPAATPPAAVEKLNREFAAALHEPDVLQKLGAVGFEIVGSTPQELDRFVRREFEHWDRFVREYNVKFD
ncbi:MAG: tripartite tricarboxylate transporter substrate binding protein [Betaproteobacteria bacterium]|nr:MAG: tripartite tricarboxylate transporter substrate binding protein [Betaproteobacteria bacterium]